MRPEQLADALRAMWVSAAEGERTPQMHLFGIRYARHLQGWTIRALGELCEAADLKASYGTELHKMVKLARYVEEKSQ